MTDQTGSPPPTPAARAGARTRRIGPATLALAGWAALWLALMLGGAEMDALTRDPAAVHGFPPWHGALSHLGIILTIGGGVAAGIAWRALPPAHQGRTAFAAAALFAVLFAADDLFLLHERVGPAFLGVPEFVPIVLHGALGVAVASLAWARLGRPAGRAMLGVLALLGASALADLVMPARVPAAVEDGFKLGGLTIWFVIWTAAAVKTLRPTGGR